MKGMLISVCVVEESSVLAFYAGSCTRWIAMQSPFRSMHKTRVIGVVETISEGSRSSMKHVRPLIRPASLTSILCCLALGIVEIYRNGDDSIMFCSISHFGQNHRRQLLRRLSPALVITSTLTAGARHFFCSKGLERLIGRKVRGGGEW